jgi:hypothetical protein
MRLFDFKNLRILLIMLLVIILLNAIAFLYVNQIPQFETKTIVISDYEQKANFTVLAMLKPNIIYGNTSLTVSENSTYREIVNELDINFRYYYSVDPVPDNSEVESTINVVLESPEKWSKDLSDDFGEEINFLDDVNFSTTLNCSAIEELVEEIDKELDMHSTIFNFYIRPSIQLKANTGFEAINDTFIPELLLEFDRDHITISGINQTKSGSVTASQRIAIKSSENQQNNIYITAGLTSAILVASTVLYVQYNPPKTLEKKIKKMVKPYDDLIVETKKPPQNSQQEIVEVKNLEDLAKISEIISRPILHFRNDAGNLFFIVENDVLYLHHVIFNSFSDSHGKN